MSRCYVTGQDGIVREKKNPKQHSEKWLKARQKRRARRAGLMPEQTRDEQGYIIKTILTTDDNGYQVYKQIKHDPGAIDRELYLRQRRQRQRDSWEVPNA